MAQAIPLPPDHAQRRRILEELDTTMLVEAAAGTGKTTSMVGRMVALLREGKCDIDTLAAVTFTRKAAAELRARFQVELERAAREAQGEAKQRLARAQERAERCLIGTIHSFCARLLRERPIEAGVGLVFHEMEKDEDLRLRDEAWSRYVARLFADDADSLTELRELGLEIGQLRDSFVMFGTYPDVNTWPAPDVDMGNLDGGRRSLEQYVAHMEELIPTFPVERGTDELMSAYERVERLARDRDLGRTPELLEVLALFKSSQRANQGAWPGGQEQGRREVARWRGFAETTAQPLVRRWQARRYATVMRILAEAAAVYDRLRAESGRLNYQDLLIYAARLLCDQPPIRRYFSRRFTHLLVDEFQDTDPIQARVMMFLTATDPDEQDWQRCVPRPGSLFVVGDPKQSIYRFRRADIVTYNQVKQMIVDAKGEVVSLTANFRTAGTLVEWGNRLFERAFPDQSNRYSPAACGMQVGRDEDCSGDLTGLRVISIPEEHGGKAMAVPYDADIVARTIRQALDSKTTVPRTRKELERGLSATARPGDFMIISWKKEALAQYARRLQELGVPCQMSGGSGLAQVKELSWLADCLEAVIEPENPVALVAVLRSELFGLSDAELYAFKCAGGKFNYRAMVPAELQNELHEFITAAFERLRRFDLWLRKLPPISAMERIASDLGLLVNALADEGGNVHAGTICKAFQVLRAAGSELYCVADLVARLRELIDQKADFDSLPARPYNQPVVRVMNLHKVKGLEAPIVFLANPTGKGHPPVKLHVDRAGREVHGYLAVYQKTLNGGARLLACPADWTELSQEEQRFTDAERTRLHYVAATRAGTQLVVTRKENKNHTNYWRFFEPHMRNCEVLSSVAGPARKEVPNESSVVACGDVHAAAADIAARWEVVGRPTYASMTAKEVAVAQPRRTERTAADGAHGTEWGTVIHLLLETAMRQPHADLERLARGTLEAHRLDTALTSTALHTVAAVTSSEIWARAKRSSQALVEVPFARCLPPESTGSSCPTLIRGVIDLAFREPAGWVIVDYKTDAITDDNRAAVIAGYQGQVDLYAQSWESLVGEPVPEKGLFFTSTGQYVRI